MIGKNCPLDSRYKLFTILNGGCNADLSKYPSYDGYARYRKCCEDCTFFPSIFDAGIFYAPYIPVMTTKFYNKGWKNISETEDIK